MCFFTNFILQFFRSSAYNNQVKIKNIIDWITNSIRTYKHRFEDKMNAAILEEQKELKEGALKSKIDEHKQSDFSSRKIKNIFEYINHLVSVIDSFYDTSLDLR